MKARYLLLLFCAIIVLSQISVLGSVAYADGEIATESIAEGEANSGLSELVGEADENGFNLNLFMVAIILLVIVVVVVVVAVVNTVSLPIIEYFES